MSATSVCILSASLVLFILVIATSSHDSIMALMTLLFICFVRFGATVMKSITTTLKYRSQLRKRLSAMTISTSTTFLSSTDLPRNLTGWALWLQVRDQGQWSDACCILPSEARQLFRWMDRHPLRQELRIRGEHMLGG